MSNFFTKRKEAKNFLELILSDNIDNEKIKQITNITDKDLKIFLEKLNKVKADIIEDQQFLYNNDPSVKDINEVSSFTSVFAVTAYRIAHIFPDYGFARQITEYAKSITGIDIHPSAKIGVPFIIDHGVGTVIGETVVIGNYSMLYHGVTLGSKYINEREQVGKSRHPKLGNNVIIYANTSIIGNIIVPDKMIIGTNKIIKRQEEIDLLKVFLESKK